jgi:hypothetical protein
VRKLVQQQPARLAARMCVENLAAQLANAFEPWAKVLRQLFVNLSAQALRDGGALTGGRDRDLQRAATNH